MLRVARQETGHTPSREKSEYWGGDIPWVGIKDAADHHGSIIHDTYQHITPAGLENSSARLLPKGTVCFSRTASVGYVTIMGREMSTSQDFATWTCTEALDAEYLMYALMAEGKNINHFGKGTTHTTIYFPEIRALHIALAPVDEQRKIARLCRVVLSKVKVIRDNVEEQMKKLNTLAQSIVAKAFHGELLEQDISDEPASTLLDHLRAERTAGKATKQGKRSLVAETLKNDVTVADQKERVKIMSITRKDVHTDYLKSIVMNYPGGNMMAVELFRQSNMSVDEFYKQLASEMKMGNLRHGINKEILELGDAP